MPMRGFCLALAMPLVAAACDGGGPPPNPKAMVGTYDVDVQSAGRADPDIMSVTEGSVENVLLTFVSGGFSEIRCTVVGSTGIRLVRQKIDFTDATGKVSDLASGAGTINANGEVDIAIYRTALSPSQATDGGSGVITYRIIGLRQ